MSSGYPLPLPENPTFPMLRPPALTWNLSVSLVSRPTSMDAQWLWWTLAKAEMLRNASSSSTPSTLLRDEAQDVETEVD